LKCRKAYGIYQGRLAFFRPLWLAASQEPGSILLTQNLHPSPAGAFLTAGIFTVLRLRRQREADVPSAPAGASPLYGENRRR